MQGVALADVRDAIPVEMFPGVVRRTLGWNGETMLCHFTLTKGARIPLHSHPAAQNGYVIRGRVRFLRDQGPIELGPGAGYLFEGNVVHGSEVLEDSEIIECFTPMRTEYR